MLSRLAESQTALLSVCVFTCLHCSVPCIQMSGSIIYYLSLTFSITCSVFHYVITHVAIYHQPQKLNFQVIGLEAEDVN